MKLVLIATETPGLYGDSMRRLLEELAHDMIEVFAQKCGEILEYEIEEDEY